jgi:hypothetical protein
LADRVISDAQLARLVEGTDQRRYHLANRAIKAGELIRLRRGLYVLDKQFRDSPSHPFSLAQKIEPGSYVSLESALAYHGWIPEAVYTTTSVLPGRKFKEYEHEQFGSFTFSPLAVNPGCFLDLVQRLQLDKQVFLLASPVRALMDLVSLKKIDWQGMSWIEDSMRIDSEVWLGVTSAELRELKEVYQHKRARHFIERLEIALGLELGVKGE